MARKRAIMPRLQQQTHPDEGNPVNTSFKKRQRDVCTDYIYNCKGKIYKYTQRVCADGV